MPALTRRRLPNRRSSLRFHFDHAGQNYIATIARYRDGRLAEVFIDCEKPGSALALHMNDAAVLASIALQHGVDADVVRRSIAGPIATAIMIAEGRP